MAAAVSLGDIRAPTRVVLGVGCGVKGVGDRVQGANMVTSPADVLGNEMFVVHRVASDLKCGREVGIRASGESKCRGGERNLLFFFITPNPRLE